MLKYRGLLENEDVKRWYENNQVGSDITADVYLRTLGLYCELEKTAPQRILEEGESKEFRDRFFDFVREMESKGKAGSYIGRFRKVLLSWLKFNNVKVELRVKIRGEGETPTISKERVPEKDELARIIRMASPRARISVALIAFSDLRPESLGDYRGRDGLKLGDLPEAKISEGEVTFEKMPTILVVRPPLSKARHQYFTFIGEEGVTYIQDYLRERVKAGEKFDRETPLLGFDPRGSHRNSFLRTALVTRDIREAITKTEFKARPYVLRAYATTQLIIAESKGYISHPYLKFIAGHKGDIEARYSTNKARLPPAMIEDMRDAYRRCLPFLQTVKSESSEDQIKRELKRQFLIIAGFSEEEVDKMDLETMPSEEIQIKVKERLLGAMINNGARQKVVSISDVERMISQGWEYVDALPEGKAVVKLPE